MKVLLVFPPYDTAAVLGFFPLGIGHPAAVLRKQSYQVKVLDLNPIVQNRSDTQMITDIIKSAKDIDVIWDGIPYQRFRQPFIEGKWPNICEACTVLNGINP